MGVRTTLIKSGLGVMGLADSGPPPPSLVITDTVGQAITGEEAATLAARLRAAGFDPVALGINALAPATSKLPTDPSQIKYLSLPSAADRAAGRGAAAGGTPWGWIFGGAAVLAALVYGSRS